MKALTLKLSPGEAGILLAIVKVHKDEGFYWGVRDQHYAAVGRVEKKLVAAMDKKA